MKNPGRRVRVALLGVHGYGRTHLSALTQLEDRVQLAAVAAARAPDPGTVPDGVAVFSSARELFQESQIDVTIVCTPIQTHEDLTIQALEAGSDVLVEKPPAASMAGFLRLLEAERRTGRVVQVGFQSLGSEAIPLLRERYRAQRGARRAVVASASWSRGRSYWNRSPWAGRRRLDGVEVVDGVITNPLSHALATALAITGAQQVEDIARVETEMYRANAIEADDTSTLRISLPDGGVVFGAFTLCAAEQGDAVVRLIDSAGVAELVYDRDIIRYDDGQTLHVGRTSLLCNLIDHRELGHPLLAPLGDTGAFMKVLEAVREAAEPKPVRSTVVANDREGEDFVVIPDVSGWVAVAASCQASFAAVGAPWARQQNDPVAEFALDGGVVAELRDGSDVGTVLSPRPYLHPLRTLRGIVVSDAFPADHPWHLGLGVALPRVGNSNFWGGPTYEAGAGYRSYDDHGAVVAYEMERTESGFLQRLEWREHAGGVLLDELRHLQGRQLSDDAWSLDWSTELTVRSEAPLVMASPASVGRNGAHYGGLFLRLATCTGVMLEGESGELDEDGAHGTVSPMLAWRAEFAGGDATVVMQRNEPTVVEPWFVRVRDYPALGVSFTSDKPVVLPLEKPWQRSFVITVVDGAVPLPELRARGVIN